MTASPFETTTTMPPNTSAVAVCPGDLTAREERIRHLSPDVREAFRRFQAQRDRVTLDAALLAVVQDYAPRDPGLPLAGMPGGTRLTEDLGFDSLTITELIFVTEDLFGITISNQEIVGVRTLDDLRSFVRGKVTAGARA